MARSTSGPTGRSTVSRSRGDAGACACTSDSGLTRARSAEHAFHTPKPAPVEARAPLRAGVTRGRWPLDRRHRRPAGRTLLWRHPRRRRRPRPGSGPDSLKRVDDAQPELPALVRLEERLDILDAQRDPVDDQCRSAFAGRRDSTFQCVVQHAKKPVGGRDVACCEATRQLLPDPPEGGARAGLPVGRELVAHAILALLRRPDGVSQSALVAVDDELPLLAGEVLDDLENGEVCLPAWDSPFHGCSSPRTPALALVGANVARTLGRSGNRPAIRPRQGHVFDRRPLRPRHRRRFQTTRRDRGRGTQRRETGWPPSP